MNKVTFPMMKFTNSSWGSSIYWIRNKALNFETGIKVVDLLAPYRRGGKIGLFGGAGG
jgi:F0F1-type ATP synthase beta subunit